jgi:hypothetical protein
MKQYAGKASHIKPSIYEKVQNFVDNPLSIDSVHIDRMIAELHFLSFVSKHSKFVGKHNPDDEPWALLVYRTFDSNQEVIIYHPKTQDYHAVDVTVPHTNTNKLQLSNYPTYLLTKHDIKLADSLIESILTGKAIQED